MNLKKKVIIAYIIHIILSFLIPSLLLVGMKVFETSSLESLYLILFFFTPAIFLYMLAEGVIYLFIYKKRKIFIYFSFILFFIIPLMNFGYIYYTLSSSSLAWVLNETNIKFKSATLSGYGNQATYDIYGNLITSGVAAGTADYRQAGEIISAHQPYDVKPFQEVVKLDGYSLDLIGTPENLVDSSQNTNIIKYFEVRPVIQAE